MSIEIHPIKLTGSWDSGYALDKHIMFSTPIGLNPYGHPEFDTHRTPIGEALYQFKYNHKTEFLTDIVDTIVDFLNNNSDYANIGAIIPAPPSKHRLVQPVFEISKAVSKKLQIPYVEDVLEKNSNIESKGLSLSEKDKIKGHITKRRRANRKHNILIIDDIFSTGATLSECSKILRTDPLVNNIYVLTITKTKHR